jgi:hypothetical protein
MRICDHVRQTKVTGGGGLDTLTWGAGELPSAGLCGLAFIGSGAATASFDKVTRLKIHSDGRPIVDINGAQWRNYVARFSLSNMFFLNGAMQWFFPFYLPDEESENLADRCQFPLGGQIQVDLTLTGLVAGDGITLGYMLTDQPAQWHPEIIGYPTTIAAGAGANKRHTLPANDGELRALAIQSANLQRIRIVHNGEQAFHSLGLVQVATSGDMALAFQLLSNGRAEAAAPLTPATNPIWIQLDTGEPTAQGRSYVEVDTAAGWAAADEIATYYLKPNGVRA